MEEIRCYNDEAGNWCDKIPKRQWTLAYDIHGRRWGHMTTNISECVNGVLKGVRSLPITALVHHTLLRCVHYWKGRREKALAMQQGNLIFSGTITTKMANNQRKATTHKVTEYNRDSGVFEILTGRNNVTGEGGNRCTINLCDKTCSCGKFQHFRFPCSHVMAAYVHINLSVNQFVDEMYTLDNILNTYSKTFYPVSHQDYWPIMPGPTLIPNPTMIRPKGRPKSTRIRNEMDWTETGQPSRCSVCHVIGHNKKTCPNRQQPRGNRQGAGPSN